MAVLRDTTHGSGLSLAARVVVGRAPTASLRLDDKRVSGEHATLLWTGTGWQVRDLGSRNGTFVDGVRLEAGTVRPLTTGCRVSFGVDDGRFVLESDGSPGALAVEEGTGALMAAVEGILALPSPDAPEVLVFVDARGRWTIEQGEDEARATDAQLVEAGGLQWRLSLPALLDSTATVDIGPTLDTVSLYFGVSMDEEHVRITVKHRGGEIALESREHAYALLTLARQRLEDAALPSAEQGWVDRERLLRWLQVDANGLNVGIYRARRQLSAAGVDGAAGIVEVRRGQRRLGVDPERLEVGPL